MRSSLAAGAEPAPSFVSAEVVHHLSREAVAVGAALLDLQRRLRTRKAFLAVLVVVSGIAAIPTAFAGFPGFSLLALVVALIAFLAYLWTEFVLDASLLTELLTDWNSHLRRVRKLSFLSPPSGPLSEAGARSAIELSAQADALRLRAAVFVQNPFLADEFLDPSSVSPVE